MNLAELKKQVDMAVESAAEYGDTPENILVSLQIDGPDQEPIWSSDVELHYDNDGMASGCVLTAFRANQ